MRRYVTIGAIALIAGSSAMAVAVALSPGLRAAADPAIGLAAGQTVGSDRPAAQPIALAAANLGDVSAKTSRNKLAGDRSTEPQRPTRSFAEAASVSKYSGYEERKRVARPQGIYIPQF